MAVPRFGTWEPPVTPSSAAATDPELLPGADPGGIRMDGVGDPAAAAYRGEIVAVDRFNRILAVPQVIQGEFLPAAQPGGIGVDHVGNAPAAAHRGEVMPVDRLEAVNVRARIRE